MTVSTQATTEIAYVISGDYRIDVLLEDGSGSNRWNSAGALQSLATVSYSFMSASPTYASSTDSFGFTAFTDNQKAATRTILSQISQNFKIDFNEVTDTASSYGQLRLGNNNQGTTSAGYAYYPMTTGDNAGDLYLNNQSAGNLSGVTAGTYAYATLVHEIGHTLGLKHPGNYNAGEAASTEPGNYLVMTEDTTANTIMSYIDVAQNQQRDFFAIYDYLALQYLYGSRSVNTGTSSYAYTNTSGQILQIINDSSGTDTMDASACTVAASIDLGEGKSSSLGTLADGLTLASNNISIAFGTTIENATGSSQADTMVGNSSANTLYGCRGNDTLSGGSGADNFPVWSSVIQTGGWDTSTDTITDFTAGSSGDILVIATGTFTNYTSGANPFASGHARLTQSGVNTLLELDVDGSGSSSSFQTAVILNNITTTNLVAVNFNGFSPTGTDTSTTSSTTSSTSSAATKATVFLGASDTFTVSNSGATLIGNLGANTAKIASGATGIKTDANFSRIELSGNLSDYLLGVVAGTGLQIQTAAGVTVDTIASMNNDITIAFANGSATLTQTGSTTFKLGGQTISTSTPATVAATLNAADMSSFGSAITTKATVFLGANDTFTVSDCGATLIGNLGSNTARIAAGVTGVKIDANFSRIELGGNLADYQMGVVAGTGLQLQNSSGVAVNTIASLNSDVTLAFTDGSATLAQTGSTVFKFGGQTISTAASAVVSATLNATDKAVFSAIKNEAFAGQTAPVQLTGLANANDSALFNTADFISI